MFTLKISKSVDNKYLFMQTHLKFTTKKRRDKFSWLCYDSKLTNNLSRARTNLFNIVNYNKFEFFYTQTISSLYARSDLKALIKKFNQITRNLRKIYKDGEFFYVFIPEYHQDKKNWHLHGFLSSGYGLDSYINKNGFLSVSSLDNIGWNSISKIKNYTACCKYITKYITKDLLNDFKKGDRIFYCSQKLKRNNLINEYNMTQIAPIHFDFKNEFVFKSTLNESQYYNFVTNIDTIKRFNYYNIK